METLYGRVAGMERQAALEAVLAESEHPVVAAAFQGNGVREQYVVLREETKSVQHDRPYESDLGWSLEELRERERSMLEILPIGKFQKVHTYNVEDAYAFGCVFPIIGVGGGITAYGINLLFGTAVPFREAMRTIGEVFVYSGVFGLGVVGPLNWFHENRNARRDAAMLDAARFLDDLVVDARKRS